MATIFPTSYSTFRASALASLLAEKYGLADVKCEFLVRGVGDTYSVETAEKKFILRVYRSTHRTLGQIKAETELLVAAKNVGVGVSYPIEDLTGNLIQELQGAEGTRHAVLFSYATGGPVTRLNEKRLRLLGHQMAQFHNVSSTVKLSDKRWNFDVETTLVEPLKRVEYAFTSNPEDFAWLTAAANQAKRYLKNVDAMGFSSGYCHFDFLPKNFHFNGDNELTFFDFDFCGYGWLVNDLMTFWQHLCLDVHFGRMTQEAADQAYLTFLEAYRMYRTISEAELAAIPYLSLGFWVFYLGFYTTHDQFFPLLQQPQLSMRVQLVRQLMERYWPEKIVV